MTERGQPGNRPRRRDRLIREKDHDPYREDAKHSEPSACPDCRAVYRAGRWHPPAGEPYGNRVVCPACRRIRDDYPAGYVTLSGPSIATRADELIALARHVEERESAEHPLKRIMAVKREGSDLVVTTTDMHLARSIGDAVVHAFQGELDYEYPKESDLLRVRWNG